MHLLKPSSLEVVQEQLQEDMCEADIADQPRWIECKYRTSHPIIRWLPTKLAAWIGDNYGQELGIPPMRGQKWTAGELNAILLHNLVPSNGGAGQLRTFGCIEWESEHYSGRPKARCYPFDLPGHRFRGKGLPCLYICPVANVLRRAPLIPCFIDCNTHPTIPYKFKNSRILGTASADTQPDRWNGSRLYKVNLWLWSYGRVQPLTMSIVEAEVARQD